MDDSAMEMTAACNINDFQSKDLIITQEKFEDLFQENHNLKKKLDVMENMNCELENELTCLSNDNLKFESKLRSLKEELDCAYVKIKQLEAFLYEEKQQMQLLKESYEKFKKEPEKKAVIVPDQEQLNILTAQIENLEILQKQDQDSIKLLQDEKTSCGGIIHQLKCEKEAVKEELSEIKEILKQKTIDIKNLYQTLESAQEDKLLLNTELQMLKSSETHAARGNSLFAEVEENRLKVAAQREVLKLKYINLKKVLNQKELENNKLKMEIVKIRREEKDDAKTIHSDYSDLLGTYKERISELEDRLKALKQLPDKPQIGVSDQDNSQLKWVNTAIENARKEAQTLQAELERRSSNYVVQGHLLFNAQKENRKLKAMNLQLQSEVDELKLNVDKIKSAYENLDDGISPPATDIAIKYQRQKTVTFKEVLHERSNTSLPSDKDSDKEN